VAKSVVCCRVSPKQKADIVSLYKKRGTWVTLSVGDGANDVSMILEANIGVGIRGKEGTQAVRAADYSISQFRFLQKLLLVHGRWGYRRVSKMICYYFYKNIILVFTEIYFALFNGFSGQVFFLDWLPMLYNALFTSWQCLFAFNFEEDVNEHYAYKYPVVYTSG
jgi:P-type E1-E2 ATPase